MVLIMTFFKDTQAVLVPAMVTIGNEKLAGGKPSSSFLQGLINPLRKRGDSADAMDCRPIALLKAGYKVYARDASSTSSGNNNWGVAVGLRSR